MYAKPRTFFAAAFHSVERFPVVAFPSRINTKKSNVRMKLVRMEWDMKKGAKFEQKKKI